MSGSEGETMDTIVGIKNTSTLPTIVYIGDDLGNEMATTGHQVINITGTDSSFTICESQPRWEDLEKKPVRHLANRAERREMNRAQRRAAKRRR
jgi:hypothetical protein